MAGANGLNFSLFFISFTVSLISYLGSPNNERLPNALGPNSALPFATPTILFSNKSSTTSLGFISL